MAAKPHYDLLNWRYAIKKMESSKAVLQQKVDAIIEPIRMDQTSSGTRPFEVFVATNTDICGKIIEVN